MSGIRIIKSEIGLRFYWAEGEPAATIYNGSNVAVINEDILKCPGDARSLAELVSIIAMVMHGIQSQEDKTNVYNVKYRNEVMGETFHAPHSPRKIFTNIYTDSVVTISRRDKVKYKLESFNYECGGTLVANYIPVVW